MNTISLLLILTATSSNNNNNHNNNNKNKNKVQPYTGAPWPFWLWLLPRHPLASARARTSRLPPPLAHCARARARRSACARNACARDGVRTRAPRAAAACVHMLIASGAARESTWCEVGGAHVQIHGTCARMCARAGHECAGSAAARAHADPRGPGGRAEACLHTGDVVGLGGWVGGLGGGGVTGWGFGWGCGWGRGGGGGQQKDNGDPVYGSTNNNYNYYYHHHKHW